jgi:cystathionine beta-lyase/cystathionine gamma-synthase
MLQDTFLTFALSQEWVLSTDILLYSASRYNICTGTSSVLLLLKVEISYEVT